MTKRKASESELTQPVVNEAQMATVTATQPETVVITGAELAMVSNPQAPMLNMQAEIAALRLELADLRKSKEEYKKLAQQGLAEMSYFVRTHGTEYAVRRLGEMTQALAAVKDAN